MRTIEVEITEILQKKVLVEVDEFVTEQEALNFVADQYGQSKLALDARDFADVSFGVVN